MVIRLKLTNSLLVLAVWCCFGSLAQAQGFRVFVEGSGSFLKNEKFFAVAASRFRSNYATGGKITIGAEYSLGKMLGLEGAFGYGSNNLRIANLSSSQEGSFGVRAQRISGNAVLHSPVAFLGARPYATAGLEYDRFGPTSQAKTQAFSQFFAGQSVTLGASNKVGFNYGGGAEWSLLPVLGLRADFRDHITGTPTYGLPSSQFGVSGAAHNAELSVGLTFHVGK